ncbi:flagellar basal body-associated FliL family protein [Psychromonas antarctica]|jgi:flagellar FliL protein|uniref:flagellar basal body-associated FliL family protein n=1 Tax=Psychromonas antarctica TaxID=67573 RepID=UPI001EE8E1C3|nr:flagellar basal body-associated FliL family protein [Psychromonas antarctica]MCG6202119.1 flagellar basal body-associated protein FliL [Psychromonas antarctica]
MLKKALFCVLCLSLFSSTLFAEEASSEDNQNGYQYFLLEPDIITNYIKPGKRIGFIRVTVELMVKTKGNYTLLEKNEPLIRDKIITVFGEQNEEIVKSVTERDSIRQRCLKEINDLLYAQTGKNPVEDLLFTKYLYQ